MARGRIKVMRVAKTSFMVAFWTAAVNLRVIKTFHRTAIQARVFALTRKPRRNRAVPAADLNGDPVLARAGP